MAAQDYVTVNVAAATKPSPTRGKRVDSDKAPGLNDELDIYEAVWQLGEPDDESVVRGVVVKPILMKSQVDIKVLGTIWNLCVNVAAKGVANRRQLNNVLHLIALNQQNKPLDLATVSDDKPPLPPTFENIPRTIATIRDYVATVKATRIAAKEKELNMRERAIKSGYHSSRVGCIQHEDFFPRLTQQNSRALNIPLIGRVANLDMFSKNDEFESMDHLLDRADTWIKTNPDISVLSVSTQFVPYSREELDDQGFLRLDCSPLKDRTYVHAVDAVIQIVRVFYRRVSSQISPHAAVINAVASAAAALVPPSSKSVSPPDTPAGSTATQADDI